MSEHLRPPGESIAPNGINGAEGNDDRQSSAPRRSLSRSPHPYHCQKSELLEPSDRLTPLAPFARASPGVSESGTEADDEHFLKRLPAPRARLHKGLRGKNEPLSGTSTPLLSSAAPEGEGHGAKGSQEKRSAAVRTRRRNEFFRRAIEVLLVICEGGVLVSNPEVQLSLQRYRKELLASAVLWCFLVVIYPPRLVLWAYRHRAPSKTIPIRIPTSFDPAPLLYPPMVPVAVSLLVAHNVEAAVLSNLVLSICALPRPLIPGAGYEGYFSSLHWLLSCLPLLPRRFSSPAPFIEAEDLVLLYPLHQTLCFVLHHLTTTSLLVSELHLLSTGLVGLLLMARSPQAVILKALLWGGGLGLMVLCGHVIQQGITLARVPKWRLRRDPPSTRTTSGFQLLRHLLPFRRRRSEPIAGYGSDSDQSTDEYSDGPAIQAFSAPPVGGMPEDAISDWRTAPADLPGYQFDVAELSQQSAIRRHTLPSINLPNRSKTKTASGRRKRATSSTVRAFFSLTHTQATIRKWLYACYVYLCILLVIFVGIRLYVQHRALAGKEPIGWALGYLLGDLPSFRFQVVKADLERWICLPPRLPEDQSQSSCRHAAGGWADRVRVLSLGRANTRLLLSGYYLVAIVAGLAVVLRLSRVCEVDTRRKVFHFMMVAMFLPTVYVDPAYVALALALVLAIFLLLDLLRASQLPPLSRPIARFLAPYVDGRDLRGPVVVSHIFLLIGCAIPLWLSLASLGRGATAITTGGTAGMRASDYDDDDDRWGGGGGDALEGWEVPTREVSMVAGVVCVGLGDAAASLVGRRWGRRKWIWGGGKSVEGSVAFATAVFAGLMAAALWLRVGGWPVTSPGMAAAPPVVGLGTGLSSLSSSSSPSSSSSSGMDSLMSVLAWRRLWPWLRVEVPKTAACASLASMTEAVLTGGNDNVIVPVVLWGCVKSLMV
ncbi:hypothetical protein VTK26DRAFT_506 [Humicola hyalothermophila]